VAEEALTKVPMKQRIKDLVSEYGKIALGVYLVLFALVYVGFLIAIIAGFETGESATGTVGAAAAAWLATKVTQPLRIGGSLILTPIVAKLLGRQRKIG